jgi:hypothetical protein
MQEQQANLGKCPQCKILVVAGNHCPRCQSLVPAGFTHVATGVDLIAAERKRQIEKEGWTPEHDSEHQRGEMAIAAACYAVESTDAEVRYPYFDDGTDSENDRGWPWEVAWDKRKKHDRLKQLIIAGALIAAEIDRLNRKPV